MADVHPLKRWTAFNAVGAVGVAVQLGVLTGLLRWFGTDYLLATALAVEAALLHNFAWHQRWTWRDRPARSARAVGARLVRFHVLNGGVSLAGNLTVMTLLTGVLGFDPILANLLAIGGCSVINFAAGTTLVFRAAPALGAVLVLASAHPAFADPGGDAVSAWNAYEASVTARHSALAAGGRSAFFIQDIHDESAQWRVAALSGEVTATGLAPPAVQGATIHHWVGAVFIPGVTLDQVLARLQAHAGAEERLYEDVLASRLLSRDGNRLRVFMKLRRKTVLTVTYNTEHSVDYRRIDLRRGASRSIATRIAELADAGTASERETPAGSDRGFLWRLNAYWRYEETSGGVLIECESVSLSRSVPALARPIVSPIVSRVARESLVRTLQGLRVALAR